MPRWLRSVVGLFLTIIFLWLLLKGINTQAFSRAFSSLSFFHILLALMFLTIAYSLRIYRWWLMLHAQTPELQFRSCIWPFLTSIAVNNVVPFRAGDILRVVGFRQQLRSPRVRIFGTMIIERILDLTALLSFFFIGLLGLPEDSFSQEFIFAATCIAGLGILGIVLIIVFSPWLKKMIKLCSHQPFFIRRNLSASLNQHGQNLMATLILIRSPKRLLVLLSVSILSWLSEGAVFATIAVAMNAVSQPLAPWFSLGTGTLATLIPSSPGYVGTFDYFAAQGLEAFGATTDISVAFALTVHLLLWLPLTATGLIYLIVHNKQVWVLLSGRQTPPTKE